MSATHWKRAAVSRSPRPPSRRLLVPSSTCQRAGAGGQSLVCGARCRWSTIVSAYIKNDGLNAGLDALAAQSLQHT